MNRILTMSRYYSREDHIPETPDAVLGYGDDAEEKKHQDFVEDVTDSPVQAYDSSNTPEALELHVRAEIDKVREGFTQVENTIKADDELNIIAEEMYNLIESKGYISSVEANFIGLSLDIVKKKVEINYEMYSSEEYRSGDHFVSQVSLEGIMQVIQNMYDIIANKIDKVIGTVDGFFKSFTPLIAKRKARVMSLLDKIDNSRRESGLKEVSGTFTQKLQIDGKIPEPKSILNNLKLLQDISNNFLGYDAGKTLNTGLQNAMDGLLKDIEAKDIKNPSKFWGLYLIIVQVIFNRMGTDVIEKILANVFGAMGSGSMVSGNARRFMVKTLGGLKFDAEGLPSLKTMYPSIAKVSLGNKAGIDTNRSDYLLGNKILVTKDLAYYSKLQDVKIDGSAKNGLNLNDLGISLQTSSKFGSESKIRVLTSSEQEAMLKQSLGLLDGCILFYKDYGSRIDQRHKAWRTAFKKANQVYDGVTQTPGLMLGAMALRVVTKYITNLYWSGIYKAQVEWIKYLNDTVDALTKYVYASMSATQINTKT